MKELEQAARESFTELIDQLKEKHFKPQFVDKYAYEIGFIDGATFVSTMMPLTNECQPPVTKDVIFYNKEWIDEDYNPQGIRIGFLDNLGHYMTAEYDNDKEVFKTRENSQIDDDPQNQVPTHWMPLIINISQ